MYKLFLFQFLLIFVAGCSEKYETPTRGVVEVFCDEAVFPVVSVLADSFNTLYSEAKVTVRKVTAKEAIARLVNRESELSIAARSINNEEESFLNTNKIEYKTMKFVYDGIVVLASFDFENKISFDSLLLILKGESKKFTAVLPERNSSVYEFLLYNVFSGENVINAELTESDSAVIARVKNNKRSIGFVSWLAAAEVTDLKKIEIGAREQMRAEDFYYQPHPGYFVQNLYPLTRIVYIYLSEINIGTASGFATFLTGNIGQKVSLDYQLGPAAVPVKIRE